MKRAEESIGQRYGRLTVVELAGRTKSREAIAQCVCDCGRTLVALLNNVRAGRTLSCGCYALELRTRHNKSRTPEYKAWDAMIQRCTNPNCSVFPLYGGRGIRVCARWRNFESFFKDMGTRPAKRELERTNNNGNYTPKNCRWATRKEQARNTRQNYLVTFKGETQPLVVWSERTGLSSSTLKGRLERGWSVLRAFTAPLHASKWDRVRSKAIH